MSKIGGKPVKIKEGVSITLNKEEINVQGPKGVLSFTIPKGINVKVEDGMFQAVQTEKNEKDTRAMLGLVRSLVLNMTIGVSEGFEKKLELVGVGYRAALAGEDLTLSVGFSHPVNIKPEPGIKFTIVDSIIVISGIDKALVGNTAARIRSIRPPEPYKGKGIKYVGEYIRRKAGKAAKAVGGAK